MTKTAKYKQKSLASDYFANSGFQVSLLKSPSPVHNLQS